MRLDALRRGLDRLHRGSKYLIFLTAFTILMLLSPVASGTGGSRLLNLLLFLLLLAVILSATENPKIFRAAVWLLILPLVSGSLSLAVQNPVLELVNQILLGSFFALSAGVILGEVFSTGEVDADKILGAICAYVLIGLVWSFLYRIVLFFDPSALAFPGDDPVEFNHLVYFSFVTLTTLGYGDIRPVDELTQMLTIFEAIVGPLFLTVLIARLVGLHVSSSQAGDRAARAPGPPRARAESAGSVRRTPGGAEERSS